MTNPIPDCNPDSPEWAFRAVAMINERDKRIAALESALQKIADGRGLMPDKSTIYMNGRVPEVPKHFNTRDMSEIALRALGEK